MIRQKKLLKKADTASSFNMLFTCLSLLILCFFIFLVANSVIDPNKKKVSIGSLIGSFGLYEGGILKLGDAKKKSLGFAMVSLSKNKDILSNLQEIVKYSKRDRWIEVKSMGKYIVLNFKKNTTFRNNTQILPVNKKIILKSFITLANRSNVSVDVFSFNSNPYVAGIRGFKIAKMLISTGLVNKENINFYGKLQNNKYDLQIRFSGYTKNSGNLSNNGIKSGDFFFKLF